MKNGNRKRGTCGLDSSVKDAWAKCKAMAKKAPPSKMCELSCVANFNYFVDRELKGIGMKVAA
jgi:hypothetical protein